MILGMVTGTVVATQKVDKIQGGKYLLVNRCDQFGKTKGDFYVALDQVNLKVRTLLILTLNVVLSRTSIKDYYQQDAQCK